MIQIWIKNKGTWSSKRETLLSSDYELKTFSFDESNFIEKFELVKRFLLRSGPSPSKIAWLLNWAG